VIRKSLASLLLLVAVGGCEAKPLPTADVATWRGEKDRFMRSADSPVPEEKRATFPPLAYFSIDPAFRVPASLSVARGNDVLQIPTSTGQRRDMRRIGTLRFVLQGKELTLTAFVDATENDMHRLFVPFGDFTNGPETYPGGRYLDLERTASGAYDLDFNRAYHPFCVYNSKYDCPYPPKENRLPLPVRAGEKLQR
jgi:uncharacterized protein